MLKKYEKPTRLKPKKWLVQTADPFSEKEETIVNLLICAEEDGYPIRYEFAEDLDGKHVYRINVKDLDEFDRHCCGVYDDFN